MIRLPLAQPVPYPDSRRLFNISLQQLVGLANVYSPIDNSVSLTWRRNLRSRKLCMREILIVEVERGLVFSGGEDSKA